MEFFKGLFRAVDVTRRVVINLLFLFLIGMVLLVLILAIKSMPGGIDENTALVLDLKGDIVEQYSVEPAQLAIDRALGQAQPETQLRDIVRALRKAAKDEQIGRVLLLTDEMGSAGMATLEELRDAIAEFRQSGKEIIAYADGMGQQQYYLAAHANKVYLNPEGLVLLEGLGRYRNYYKDALEALKVDVHLFRVGEFKSAAEPYIRTDMSEQDKESGLFWMNDLWSRMLDDVAKARKIDRAKLETDINAYADLLKAAGGDAAKVAVDMGLVDALKTRDEVRAMLIEAGVQDEESKSFRQIALTDYIAAPDPADVIPSDRQVAIVVAQGEIVDGDKGPSVISGDATSRLIRKAREDEDVKALVLRVDSPGGGVFPSELIRREVELTRAAGKPVVVSMGDLAASGGYWISMNADAIYARPTTITGSIGIFGLFFKVPRTLAEYTKVYSDGVGTTRWAGAFNLDRPLPPEAGEAVQTLIDKGYQDFVGKVAEARKKKFEDIDAIARGRVWSGAQAKGHGIVDELGGLDAAVKAAATKAKLGDDFVVRYRAEQPEGFAAILQQFTAKAITALNIRIDLPWSDLRAFNVSEQVRDDLKFVTRRGGLPIKTYAHCFCELQ
jgi:protease IV